MVAGARAQFKGVGTVNGTGDYGFILNAVDGQLNGGGDVDKFRIKIWDRNNGDAVVYDNQLGATDGAFPTTALRGGQIVIHADVSASVVGRHIFYKDSAFDQSPGVLDALDDSAIDSSKSALLPGQTATFINTTGFSRGLNGFMIDVANLAKPNASVLADDISLRTGNNNDTSTWDPLDPALIELISIRKIAANTHRITVALVDDAVKNTWLEVSLSTSADTGLIAPDVHYWGNAVGNTGNDFLPGIVDVSAADWQAIHANLNSEPTNVVTNRFDLNKDRFSDQLDMDLVLATLSPNVIHLITASAATSASAGVANPAIEMGGNGLQSDFSEPAVPAEAIDGRVASITDGNHELAFATFDADEHAPLDMDLLEMLAVESLAK